MKLFRNLIVVWFMGVSLGVQAADMGSGQKVYDQSCVNCHSENTAGFVNAPALHDKKAWQERFKAAQKKNFKDRQTESAMAILIDKVKKGTKEMMPGGMCPDCSDKDFEDAIRYMSEE